MSSTQNETKSSKFVTFLKRAGLLIGIVASVVTVAAFYFGVQNERMVATRVAEENETQTIRFAEESTRSAVEADANSTVIGVLEGISEINETIAAKNDGLDLNEAIKLEATVTALGIELENAQATLQVTPEALAQIDLNTSTPTQTPSSTNTPTPIGTPTSTPTPLPTNTATATPTPIIPTAVPTVGPPTIGIDLSVFEIGDWYQNPQTNLLIDEVNGRRFLKGANDNGKLEITNFNYRGSFEIVVVVDLNLMVNTEISLFTNRGEEITVSFTGDGTRRGGEFSFGNLTKAFNDDTGWEGDDGINEIKLDVNTENQTAKIFINDVFFNTIIISSDDNFTRLEISGIRQVDLLFEVTGRLKE